MRLVTITLAILLLLIQYPLWIGKGGFFRVRELSLQLEEVKQQNEAFRLRNAKLASEVKDLEVGTDAIEERARYELGMIKKNEVFIQIIDKDKFKGKGKIVDGELSLPLKTPETVAAENLASAKNKTAEKALNTQTKNQQTERKEKKQSNNR